MCDIFEHYNVLFNPISLQSVSDSADGNIFSIHHNLSPALAAGLKVRWAKGGECWRRRKTPALHKKLAVFKDLRFAFVTVR